MGSGAVWAYYMNIPDNLPFEHWPPFRYFGPQQKPSES